MTQQVGQSQCSVLCHLTRLGTNAAKTQLITAEDDPMDVVSPELLLML
jgi:hypothetical protein